ncbi:MAG: glycosyltransferase family 1 protein [bacterium]
MTIGVDARFWSQTGVGRYIRELIKELAKQDQKNSYVLFLTPADFNTVSLPANFQKVCTAIRWHTVAEQLILPIHYLWANLDVLLVPNFNVPLLYPKKLVTTVHDLTLLRTRTGRSTRLPYPVYLIKYLAGCLVHFAAVKKSSKIFTVSQYVKTDLVKTFGLKPEKIILTPNAVVGSFMRCSEEKTREVLRKYGIDQPYLFYVGNACLHKNLWRLVKAFELLSRTEPELLLVLGGKMDFNYERLAKQFSGLACAQRIRLTGFLPDADLPGFYSGAGLYVNPSLYEGFGIQVLEAFACGCKVACANSTSLPEVGGALAAYFDPNDEQDMAAVIKRTLHETAPDFAAKAQKHVRQYSWSTSAQTVLQTLQSL